MATLTRSEENSGLSDSYGALREGVIDPELSARKRAQVGLSPRRPTAKAAPLRPPSSQSLSASPAVLPLFLGVILTATLLLVFANMLEWFPNWWSAPAVVADSVRNVSLPLGDSIQITGYELALADDFSQAGTIFPEGAISGEWRVEHSPTSSSYRMEVWPNHVVWSLVESSASGLHRTQASVVVASHTPWGYAGIVNRYSNEDFFYLFLVDGQGRYSVQVQDAGELISLQEWTEAEFLNRAGSANILTVDDDGGVQRFYGNNILLFETPVKLPSGNTGLAGGANQDGLADIAFDWIQLFDLQVR